MGWGGGGSFELGFIRMCLDSFDSSWTRLDSHGFTWTHPAYLGHVGICLDSVGLALDSLGITLDSFGFHWIHLDSIRFNWIHFDSLGFI